MLAIRPYSANNIGLGNTLSASTLSLVIKENAPSIASGLAAATNWSCIPSLRAEKNCPGYIPAWSSKASDQIVLYGIGHGDHDNGNDAGRLLERPRGRRT